MKRSTKLTINTKPRSERRISGRLLLPNERFVVVHTNTDTMLNDCQNAIRKMLPFQETNLIPIITLRIKDNLFFDMLASAGKNSDSNELGERTPNSINTKDYFDTETQECETLELNKSVSKLIGRDVYGPVLLLAKQPRNNEGGVFEKQYEYVNLNKDDFSLMMSSDNKLTIENNTPMDVLNDLLDNPSPPIQTLIQHSLFSDTCKTNNSRNMDQFKFNH